MQTVDLETLIIILSLVGLAFVAGVAVAVFWIWRAYYRDRSKCNSSNEPQAWVIGSPWSEEGQTTSPLLQSEISIDPPQIVPPKGPAQPMNNSFHPSSKNSPVIQNTEKAHRESVHVDSLKKSGNCVQVIVEVHSPISPHHYSKPRSSLPTFTSHSQESHQITAEPSTHRPIIRRHSTRGDHPRQGGSRALIRSHSVPTSSHRRAKSFQPPLVLDGSEPPPPYKKQTQSLNHN